MNTNKFLYLLVCFSLIFFAQFPQNASAQNTDPCVVVLQPGQKFNLSECSSFVFISGWIATTKGLVNEFQKGTLVTAEVTGPDYSRVFTPDEVNQLYLEPIPLDPDDLGVDCPMPTIWVVDYVLDLGGLEDGTYALELVYEFTHPVNDGFHVCSIDGEPIPNPSLFSGIEIYSIDFDVNP